MRLINADDLITRYCSETCGLARKDCGLTYEDDGCEACSFVREIEQEQTIDAVPVVRCKDCKWYDSVFFRCTKSRFCPDPDFFCACGAKMDGGETNAAD